MRVAVIGAGSWGTALAQVAARAGNDVRLWARRAAVADGVNRDHRNPDYLSQHPLSERIGAVCSIPQALEGAELVLVVTPSKAMGATACDLRDAGLPDDALVMACTKGVEGDSGLVPVQILERELGHPGRLGCLSGPNHAEEVIEGLPTATVAASRDDGTACQVQEALGSESFRVYTSNDTVGVELCAAAKNVVAIAVGLSYGLGFGDNTAAMLMTRGQAEMGRLVKACGGSPITCMGLAGTGDLVATCMSPHSRNRSFGQELAQGVSLEAYEARRHMVVEGAQACRSILSLAQRKGVELPLAQAVRAVVWEGCDARAVARELLERPLKPEFY